jgi:hypothetical protein
MSHEARCTRGALEKLWGSEGVWRGGCLDAWMDLAALCAARRGWGANGVGVRVVFFELR